MGHKKSAVYDWGDSILLVYTIGSFRDRDNSFMKSIFYSKKNAAKFSSPAVALIGV